MQNLCFAPSVALKHHSPNSLRPNKPSTLCTIAPQRPTKSSTTGTKQNSKPTHRILPENLPKADRPPTPPEHRSIPIFGFYLEKLFGVSTTPKQKRERYGPIYSSNYFIDQRTYISDYQATYEAFRNEDVFRVEGSFDVFKFLFGEGNFLVSDFDVHRGGRNSVLPAFAPGIFNQYMEFVRKRANKTWKRVLERYSAGEEIKLEPVFRDNYLSIVVEMSTSIDMDSERSARIRDLFQRFLLTLFSPQFGPVWTSGMEARETLLDIIADVARTKLRERPEDINKLREYGDRIMKMGVKEIRVGDLDILTVLIAADARLSTAPGAVLDEEAVKAVSNLVLITWFGGYTTSASTSMCMSFEMGLDDSIRDQLVAEQDSIVAAANGVKEVTYQQVQTGMPVLDSYIQEILRTRPPIGILGRKVSKDVEILGRYVPKDSLLYFDLVGLHLDPKIYPDPEKIVVDRFVKREGKPKPPGVLAFGVPGTPHYCIGAALAKVMMKTTMGTLLREYSYVLDKKQRKDYRSVPEIAPKSGVVLESFKKRS